MIDDEHTWINGAQYSDYGATLNWGTTGFAVEHAVTFINWKYNYSDSWVGKFGFVWNKSFIFGDQETGHVFLSRNVLSELFIAPFHLELGENDVKVTMSDRENSRDASAKIYLIEDLHEAVAWNKIKDSSVDASSTAVLPIDGESIESGNSLQISAKSNNENALTISDAFFAKHVKMTWDSIQDPAGNFFFDGDKAVIEMGTSGGKQLVFSTCTQSVPGADISCKVSHSIPLSPGDVMGSKIASLSNGLTVAYTTNESKDSSTLIAVTEDHVYQHNHEGIITGFAGYPGATSALDAVAISMSEYVVILEVNPNDIQEWNQFAFLDKTHFDVTDFCPTEVRSKKGEHHGGFAILSNCHGGKNYSQEIFTFAMTKNTPSPSLPLSSLDSPRNICAFFEEIIVATNDRVYGVSIWDDWNYWSIPIEDFGVDKDNFDLDCIESRNTAVITGHDEGTTQKALIQLRGDSGNRQDRRYPHTVNSISADVIYTYDFLGSTFHYGLENGNHVFVQSYLDPKVIVQSKAVTQTTEVEVEVTIQNGHKTANTTTKVTVNKPSEKKTEEQ